MMMSDTSWQFLSFFIALARNGDKKTKTATLAIDVQLYYNIVEI